jgi:hypothetical protein
VWLVAFHFDLYQSNITSNSHTAEFTFYIFNKIFVLQIVKPESEMYVLLVADKLSQNCKENICKFAYSAGVHAS